MFPTYPISPGIHYVVGNEMYVHGTYNRAWGIAKIDLTTWEVIGYLEGIDLTNNNPKSRVVAVLNEKVVMYTNNHIYVFNRSDMSYLGKHYVFSFDAYDCGRDVAFLTTTGAWVIQKTDLEVMLQNNAFPYQTGLFIPGTFSSSSSAVVEGRYRTGEELEVQAVVYTNVKYTSISHAVLNGEGQLEFTHKALVVGPEYGDGYIKFGSFYAPSSTRNGRLYNSETDSYSQVFTDKFGYTLI